MFLISRTESGLPLTLWARLILSATVILIFTISPFGLPHRAGHLSPGGNEPPYRYRERLKL
jgi:hypothetical protein